MHSEHEEELWDGHEQEPEEEEDEESKGRSHMKIIGISSDLKTDDNEDYPD